MANPNAQEIVASTLRARRKKIADGVTRNSAGMMKLREKGRVKLQDGGRSLTEPIMYGENANFQWYRGREPLNTAPQEVLTHSEFVWKQYACGVSIAGDELMMNSGEGQFLDMLAARIEHAEKTIVNQMSSAFYGDGTAFAGKAYGGIGLLNSAGAGATVGGIDSNANAWWRNRILAGGAPSTANIYGNMLTVFLDLQVGSTKPDLGLADNTYYRTFSSYLQAQQRFMDARLANAGFVNLMFENMPIVPDGGQDGFAPVGIHFLTCEMLRLCMHSKRNNVVLRGAAKRPINEDSETVIIAGMGNFTVSNRRHLGRLVS